MGYARALVSSTRTETLGVSGGSATILTSGAADYGSLATLGTTSFSYDGLLLSIGLSGTPGGRLTLTANTGGADEPIVTDLYVTARTAGNTAQGGVTIPVGVPKGAVVKGQIFTSIGSETALVSVLGWQGDAKQTRGFRGLASLTAFSGFGPGNNLTLTGATQTGWVQVIAASPYRVAGLYAGIATAAPTTSTPLSFDIGWGALGSEQRFCTMTVSSTTPAQQYGPVGPIPCDFPAGTRFVWRATASAANTSSLSLVLNGLAA